MSSENGGYYLPTACGIDYSAPPTNDSLLHVPRGDVNSPPPLACKPPLTGGLFVCRWP